MINKENIEEYLFRAAEKDLTAEEQQMLDQFISKHPEYRADLLVFEQTVLQPNNVVFAHKKLLYKPEEDRRILFMPLMWRVAAVFALLLSSVSAYYYFISSSTQRSEAVVVVKPKSNSNPVQIQSENVNSDKTETSVQPLVTQPVKPSVAKHLNAQQKNIQSIEKNISQPVTITPDTTLHSQMTNNIVQQMPTTNAINPVDYAVQPELIHQPQQQPHTMPQKKLNKRVELVSRLLRKTGNKGLANGVEYVAQLKDKEIEISYNSRYINFQKSFSLSKL